MNRGEDSGPCPRCKGPTVLFDYDEAPWGARGNYSYSCKTCGTFGEKPQDPENPTPFEYIFYNDQANARLRAELLIKVAAMSDTEISELWARLQRIADASPFEIQFSDKACPPPVDMAVMGGGFAPGVLITEFTSIKTRLPAGATVLSEMTPRVTAKLQEVSPAKRCNRCCRLEETCDSGMYGDCIDYRRQ
jgi:hypothetical protein